MIDPRKIWNSPLLPTLPSVAIRMIELSKDPEVEIQDVIETIKADPAISAKILKSTNSSFFGVSNEVTSIDRAVPLLGSTMVTSLALSFSLAESTISSGPLTDYYQSYWVQSVVQGVAAEVIGKTRKDGLNCEYFLAGLLMDLGQLAMLKSISDEYLEVLNTTKDQQRPLYEVETELLGFNHIEIGMKMMLNWNLPELIIDGVRFHHASWEQLQEHAKSKYFYLTSTMAAAAAVGDYFCSEDKGQALIRLRKLTSEFFTITEPDIQCLLEQVKIKVDESRDVFAIDPGELSSPTDLMAQANEQLVQLTLREHVASTKAMAMHQVTVKEKQILKSKHEQLRAESVHDSLTKTYNRTFFEEAIKKKTSLCAQAASPVGLIFCDIDHFKDLNDTYGHPFGDIVLQKIVDTFREQLRDSDVLSRYGGEEFVILINQPTEKGIERIAERIRKGVEETEIILDGTRIPVTVSLGAAIAIPNRVHENFESGLIAIADEAMYSAKENGRNQVFVDSRITDLDRQLLNHSNQMRFSRWIVERKILDIPAISQGILQCKPSNLALGEIAQQHGILTEQQIQEVLQSQGDQRFGETAIRLGIMTPKQVARCIALQREDPNTLANALVQQGILESDFVDALLQEYLAELETCPDKPLTESPTKSLRTN